MRRPVADKKSDLTPRQEARLGRILHSARDLLGEVGAERMTMRDLAVASGVSAATLYNRFGTKDSLIAHAVVDHYREAIVKVVARGADAESPVEHLDDVIRVIVRDCLRRPAFASALMSAYFKIGNDREMPTQLYQSLLQSWLPPLQQLHDAGALRDWASVPVLAEELSERMFGVVMKWSQGMISDRSFPDRARLSILLPLLAASRGKTASELEALVARCGARLSAPRARKPVQHARA